MKKNAFSCILAGILLTAFLVLFSTGSNANLMPEETLDDDTEETDSSFADSEIIEEDLRIFLSSPQGSAIFAATEEEDLESILDINSPNADKSLNEIRFDGWTDDDFFNNDYLRAFRRYMDAYLQGKEFDETEADPSVLEPYRERLRGKYLVHDVRVFPFGGLLYSLIPIDDAALMLKVWIYSTVEDNGHINAYLVRYVGVAQDIEEMLREEGISKDTLRQRLLKAPWPDLW